MKDILTRPVVGWALKSVAGMAVLMDLRTVGSDAELQAAMAGRGKPHSLPALLSPQQALDLAAALQRAAAAILGQQTPPRSGQS